MCSARREAPCAGDRIGRARSISVVGPTQHDHLSSHHFTGLGLGLYISRQIVEAHGGTIRVESELGKGATFAVELPCEGPGKEAAAE